MTNNLRRLFNIKNIAFYGTKEDLDDYNNQIGNATTSEINLRKIVHSFEQDSHNKEKNYMICKLGDSHTLALLWNSNNMHSSYMMIYNFKTDKRIYSVEIADIPDSFENDIIEKIVQKTPQICKFTGTMLDKQSSKDIWMLDDLQKFADSIDSYIENDEIDR